MPEYLPITRIIEIKYSGLGLKYLQNHIFYSYGLVFVTTVIQTIKLISEYDSSVFGDDGTNGISISARYEHVGGLLL